jgi:hypothetical protein
MNINKLKISIRGDVKNKPPNNPTPKSKYVIYKLLYVNNTQNNKILIPILE